MYSQQQHQVDFNSEYNATLTTLNTFDQNQNATKKDFEEFRKNVELRMDEMKTQITNFQREQIARDEGIKTTLSRILEEVKSMKKNENTQKQGSYQKLVPSPFVNLDDFKTFEKLIEECEEKFAKMVSEFKQMSCSSLEKYVSMCWRKVLTDEIAQQMCWRGTPDKVAVRCLSLTAAIKHAVNEKFASTDREFEKACIQHFQYAKIRSERKTMRKLNRQQKENIPSN